MLNISSTSLPRCHQSTPLLRPGAAGRPSRHHATPIRHGTDKARDSRHLESARPDGLASAHVAGGSAPTSRPLAHRQPAARAAIRASRSTAQAFQRAGLTVDTHCQYGGLTVVSQDIMPSKMRFLAQARRQPRKMRRLRRESGHDFAQARRQMPPQRRATSL